jgi:hypothetical protein
MLDFPNSPTVGQVFGQWVWDGGKWGPTAGSAAPINSPSFTGDPKAPTPATGDNDTSIATTAFVKAQGYLLNNQLITLSGDVGGSGATAIAATLATVNANVGTFAIQTVNAKGLVTAAANMTGDVTTSGGAATLATVNSNVGTFQGLTLDAKGRVTAAANQNYVTGGPYLPLAGGSLSGALSSSSSITAGQGGLLANPTTGSALTLASPNGVRCVSSLTIAGTRTWLHQLETNGFYQIVDNTGGPVTRIQIDLSGNCQNTTGTWAAFSDVALKENVTDYTAGLSQIIQLRPVTFGWVQTDYGPEQNWGLIAQEVEPVMPELIGEAPASVGREDGAATMLKTVDYGRIIFSVINALKEVSERLSALEAQLPPAAR